MRARYFEIFTLDWNNSLESMVLREFGAGAVGKTSLVKWLKEEEVRANIFGLGPRLTEACWKRFSIKRQREIVWLAFHGALLIISFLKSRDLVRDEKCPRERSGEMEMAKHALYGCSFAQRIHKRLVHFVFFF